MQTLSAGIGISSVHASLQVLGRDVLIAVWGGTQPHIGALAVSVPRPGSAPDEMRSSAVLHFSFPGHRDEQVARLVADRVAAVLQRTVTVSAGIHIPGITPEVIEQVLTNTDSLIGIIIHSLRSREHA